MTGPVSSRETGIRLPIRSALDVCSFVDRLDRAVVGELVIEHGGRVRGAVFIEGGRVCWVAAHGLAARLTQLLMSSSGVDAATMEGLYRRCKAEGSPLGEALVSYGIVEPEALRSALLQHTTESLLALVGETDAVGAFRRRSAGGYCPRFTFATSELLARVTAERNRDAAAAVHEELAAFTAEREDEWGAAFVRVGAVPLPVVLVGALPSSATGLLRVGRWAASALDVAQAFQGADGGEEDTFVTSGSGDSALVAWRVGGGSSTFVAGRMGKSGPARILNRRASARRARSLVEPREESC